MNNYFKSNPAILNEARGYLDGLLLGDGGIPWNRSSNKTNLYSQKCEHKSWLDRISEDLYEYNIKCNVDNGRLYTGGWNPEGGSIRYYLQTCYYIEFKEMDNRWYKHWYDITNYSKTRWHIDERGDIYIRKKIVPKDICLTPECVANWYLGDGTCPKPSYDQINISTDGFLREDTVFLSELLSETLDIKTTVTKVGKIYIGIKADISTFLNYMKDCEIPDCYSYKFPEGAMR